MNDISLIDSNINTFYTIFSEENRLKQGLGPLEFERSKELIQRYLPAQKSRIIDVGGGPGIYAEWLSNLGHHVLLIDPVLKHIQQAKKRAGKLKKPFQCIIGEAEHLSMRSNYADVIILHGPLYHLQEKIKRLNAINESRRILKKGGVILGFAINHTVSSVLGLLNGYIHHPLFFKMCVDELKSGKHYPAQGWPGLLPKAYFHKPEELQKEFEFCEITCLDIVAVESIIWLDKDYFESRGNPEKNRKLMELLKLIEKEKSLLGISPHIMIAGRKE